MCGTVQRSNIHVTEVPKERRERTGKLFGKLLAENFPNLTKDI